MSILLQYGISVFNILFWFKIATLALITYLINIKKEEEFYYYKNLGLTKRFLLLSTLITDLVIFISLLIVTNILR